MSVPGTRCCWLLWSQAQTCSQQKLRVHELQPFPLLWPQATASTAPGCILSPFAWWSCLNKGEGSNFLYSLRMKWYFTAAKLYKDLRLTSWATGSNPILKPLLHYRILPSNMQWREWDVSKCFFFNKLKKKTMTTYQVFRQWSLPDYEEIER